MASEEITKVSTLLDFLDYIYSKSPLLFTFGSQHGDNISLGLAKLAFLFSKLAFTNLTSAEQNFLTSGTCDKTLQLWTVWQVSIGEHLSRQHFFYPMKVTNNFFRTNFLCGKFFRTKYIVRKIFPHKLLWPIIKDKTFFRTNFYLKDKALPIWVLRCFWA